MSRLAQTLRPMQQRLQRAWINSPWPRFFHWWGGELGALLPPRWRQWFKNSASWYVLSYQAEHWLLQRAGAAADPWRWSDALAPALQRAKLQQAWSEVAAEDLRLVLCLSSAAVVRRRLSLPLAARDSLQQVAAYEMDRQTPFRTEQVYYGIRVLSEPAAPGRVWAELVAVPRPMLDVPLARLRELAVAVDAVDVQDGDSRLGLNLLPVDLLPRRRHPRRRFNMILVALVCLLLWLSMSQWLRNRQAVLTRMQAQVEQMRATAQRVAMLRRQWQSNVAAGGFLIQRKINAPSVLALVEELTRRLPDDTWLERLELDNSGRLSFQGQSTQAAKLVDSFKGVQLFTEPNFLGSIQRDGNTGKERFYMAAQLRQQAAPAPHKRSRP